MNDQREMHLLKQGEIATLGTLVDRYRNRAQRANHARPRLCRGHRERDIPFELARYRWVVRVTSTQEWQNKGSDGGSGSMRAATSE